MLYIRGVQRTRPTIGFESYGQPHIMSAEIGYLRIYNAFSSDTEVYYNYWVVSYIYLISLLTYAIRYNPGVENIFKLLWPLKKKTFDSFA